jgi:hypothetical protein
MVISAGADGVVRFVAMVPKKGESRKDASPGFSAQGWRNSSAMNAPPARLQAIASSQFSFHQLSVHSRTAT